MSDLVHEAEQLRFSPLFPEHLATICLGELCLDLHLLSLLATSLLTISEVVCPYGRTLYFPFQVKSRPLQNLGFGPDATGVGWFGTQTAWTSMGQDVLPKKIWRMKTDIGNTEAPFRIPCKGDQASCLLRTAYLAGCAAFCIQRDETQSHERLPLMVLWIYSDALSLCCCISFCRIKCCKFFVRATGIHIVYVVTTYLQVIVRQDKHAKEASDKLPHFPALQNAELCDKPELGLLAVVAFADQVLSHFSQSYPKKIQKVPRPVTSYFMMFLWLFYALQSGNLENKKELIMSGRITRTYGYHDRIIIMIFHFCFEGLSWSQRRNRSRGLSSGKSNLFQATSSRKTPLGCMRVYKSNWRRRAVTTRSWYH